jgi:hypothetical protein
MERQLMRAVALVLTLVCGGARAEVGSAAVVPVQGGVQLLVDNMPVVPDFYALPAWVTEHAHQPLGWQSGTLAGAPAAAEWYTRGGDYARTGSRSLELTEAAGTTAAWATYTGASYVTPGHEYQFTAFVKGTAGCTSGLVWMHVQWFTGPFTTDGSEGTPLSSVDTALAACPTDWTALTIDPATEVNAQAPANATFFLVELFAYNAPGSVWFDDLTIEDQTASQTQDTQSFEVGQGEIGRYAGQFRDAGVHLYRMRTMLADAWQSNGTFEFTALDRAIDDLVATDGTARMLLEVGLDPPGWWLSALDSELTVYSDGSTAADDPNAYLPGQVYPSVASNTWRDGTEKALGALVQHVMCKPVAEDVTPPGDCHGASVIGYQLDAGHTGEWIYFGNGNKNADFSAPMTTFIQKCLAVQYGTDDALQKAWNNPNVSLSNFVSSMLPSHAQAAGAPTDPLFLDPAQRRDVIDFHRCLNNAVASAIEDYSGVVRGLAPSVLVGVYGGYLFEEAALLQDGTGGHVHYLQESGHRMFAQLLDSKTLDFLIAPAPYSARQLVNDGPGGYMSAVDSVGLHGKLWIQEEDIRTSTSGLPDDHLNSISDTVCLLNRDFGLNAVKNVGQWWYDMNGGWYDDPGLQLTLGPNGIKREMSVAGSLLNADRSSVAEIAVVVDDESAYYQVLNDQRMMPALLDHQRYALGHMGAPFDVIYLADALAPGARDYKMYILLNTFVMNDVQRAQVTNRLQVNGHVLVWVYAPGYVSVDASGNPSLSVTAMSQVVGMNVEQVPGSIAPQVQYQCSGATCSGGILDGVSNAIWPSYGDPTEVTPLFSVIDSTATTLGTIAGTSLVGLAYADRGTYRTVYSAAPDLPADLLRRLAALAGAHIYLGSADFEAMGVSKELMVIQSKVAATPTITLHERSTVTDLTTGQVWPAVLQLSLPMADKDTHLLWLAAGGCPDGDLVCTCDCLGSLYGCYPDTVAGRSDCDNRCGLLECPVMGTSSP